MAVGRLRRNWFYPFLIFQIALSLCSLVFSTAIAAGVMQNKSYTTLERAKAVLQILLLFLCLSNAVFLATYGSLYTKTILGSFVVQQPVSLLIVAWCTGLMVSPGTPLAYRPISDYLTIGSTALAGIISLILSCLFIHAKRSGDRILGHWPVNVEDLASGVPPPPVGKALSWRGVRRHEDRLPRRARMAQVAGRFIHNSILRRVHPVETKSYAFFQHFFSLIAIVLLLTRTVVLLVQLGNDGLPSRSRVERPESFGSVSSRTTSVLVRYPNHRNWPGNRNMNPSGTSTFNVSIALQTNSTSSFSNSTNLCNAKFVQTRPNSANITDWFWHHTCDNLEQWRAMTDDNSFLGFQYTMTTSMSPQDSRNQEVPDIWIVAGVGDPDLRTPYFAAPIQPIPEIHSVYHTHFAFRRSVSSSPLWDAISGSKPTYNTVKLYPGVQLYSQPMRRTDDPENVMLYSSGFIYWPRYLHSSPETSQSDFEPGTVGPRLLVEVTEEYRVGSTFDILASIGGLFALLQGIHVFLFGRPLFWGMFGTKMISPFGFVGRFATRDFRQRLHEHYYHTDPRTTDLERNGLYPNDNVDMSRFLLDFVLDLGPASATGQDIRLRRAQSNAETRVEMGDLGRSKESLSHESDVPEKEDLSFLPSTRF